MQRCILSIAILWTGAAHAHDGHGLGGAHWHATDTVGWLAAAAIAAGALWWSRRK